MNVTIKINCDNAAFGNDGIEAAYEVRRILENLTRSIDTVTDQESIRLIDSNGNTVGAYTVTK